MWKIRWKLDPILGEWNCESRVFAAYTGLHENTICKIRQASFTRAYALRLEVGTLNAVLLGLKTLTGDIHQPGDVVEWVWVDEKE